MSQQQAEKGPITRNDVFQSFLRWLFFSHANYNWERYQGTGFAHAMTPIIRKLYKDPEEIKAALKRHLVFFNTEPDTGGVKRLAEEDFRNAPEGAEEKDPGDDRLCHDCRSVIRPSREAAIGTPEHNARPRRRSSAVARPPAAARTPVMCSRSLFRVQALTIFARGAETPFIALRVSTTREAFSPTI